MGNRLCYGEYLRMLRKSRNLTISQLSKAIGISSQYLSEMERGGRKCLNEENAGLCIYNLGTGRGYSVLEVIHNFEEASGVKIPYSIRPRRAGDIATCYADASKAKAELGWEAKFGIKEMCEDSWRWQKNNPEGY